MATNNTTKTSHTNTCSHNQTQTNHKHITYFQHRYRPTSFQVARGLHSKTRTVVSCMKRTCSHDREWAKAHALRYSGKLEPCVHRERADWTSDHCHCCWERRERREERLDWGASAVSSRALIWRFWYEGRTWHTTLNLIITRMCTVPQGKSDDEPIQSK